MLTLTELIIAMLAFAGGAVTATGAIWIWMYRAMMPPRNRR